MRWLSLLCLILFMHNAAGQNRSLKGVVRTIDGKPLPHVSVLLKVIDGRILAFVNTGSDGKYELVVNDTVSLNGLTVEINALQYHAVKQEIQPGKQVYDFLLREKVISLPEVKTKSRPVITQSGDTLSYNVSSFSREEDRTIGDVIGRLPGIVVADNGMIYYNGKAIFNLYVHGDDLMDGRYQLATKVINKDMIRSIEVIQNVQPVKVLKDKVISDNIALNLVLKDENSVTLSGQAMLGVGLPEQFDAKIDLLLFNKKFKTLNTIKANNSGIDYMADLAQFGASSFLENEGNTRPGALLSAGTAGVPDIPRSNYFINRSGIASVNTLINTKKEWQLRVNLQALADRNMLNYSTRVDNYLQDDTIRYSEEQHSVKKPWLFNTSLSLMANKKHYYFSEVLRLNFNGEQTRSNMDLNGHSFSQRLRETVKDLSNTFTWAPLIGKGTLNASWYLNYYNAPQRLDIADGLNEEVLNGGQSYLAILQHASIPTLFSHASLAYQPKSELIRQSYQIGFLNEKQELNSLLQLQQQDGTYTNYKSDPGNALSWNRDRLYIKSAYNVQRKRWRADLSVPLIWQSVRYRQAAYALDHSQNRFLVNPVAVIRLSVGAEDYLEFNYSYTNSIGNIAGVYRGAVLTNYRMLNANDAELQEKYTTGPKLAYNFQRSIIMLFINAEAGYSKVRANSVFSSTITDNVQRTILLPYENDQDAFFGSASVSKYIFDLRATGTLKASFRKSRYEQFINNERLPFRNDVFLLTGGIDAKLWKKLTIAYNGTGSISKSRLESKSAGNLLKTETKRLTQRVTLGYSPVKLLFINVKAWQTYSTQVTAGDVHYVFTDLNVRYKISKWRADLELDITNLADIRIYGYFSLSSNRFSDNNYDIRGRMAIMRFTFNL